MKKVLKIMANDVVEVGGRVLALLGLVLAGIGPPILSAVYNNNLFMLLYIVMLLIVWTFAAFQRSKE